jgi:hypothetical protein
MSSLSARFQPLAELFINAFFNLADCQEKIGIVCRVWKNSDFSSDCNGTTYIGSALNADNNTLDLILNPEKKNDSSIFVNMLKTLNKNLFKRLNQTTAYKTLFKILWYSTLPCFDVNGITSRSDGEKGMLRSCQWKGKDIPCAAIFTQVYN